MTARRPCPPAPGPLEDYAKLFDPLFHSLAQRRNFRTYLAGLLAPRDRPKTLTALAGANRWCRPKLRRYSNCNSSCLSRPGMPTP
jgi:hypothetical protein